MFTYTLSISAKPFFISILTNWRLYDAFLFRLFFSSFFFPFSLFFLKKKHQKRLGRKNIKKDGKHHIWLHKIVAQSLQYICVFCVFWQSLHRHFTCQNVVFFLSSFFSFRQKKEKQSQTWCFYNLDIHFVKCMAISRIFYETKCKYRDYSFCRNTQMAAVHFVSQNVNTMHPLNNCANIIRQVKCKWSKCLLSSKQGIKRVFCFVKKRNPLGLAQDIFRLSSFTKKIMTLIFQLTLLALVGVSFLLVVGVPVVFASPDGWTQNKGTVFSGLSLWTFLLFLVAVLNSFVV